MGIEILKNYHIKTDVRNFFLLPNKINAHNTVVLMR